MKTTLSRRTIPLPKTLLTNLRAPHKTSRKDAQNGRILPKKRPCICNRRFIRVGKPGKKRFFGLAHIWHTKRKKASYLMPFSFRKLLIVLR
jgi:hypothetical protein